MPQFKPQVDYHTALVQYVGAAHAESNTDMYYARQVVEALERIHDTTFRLSALPIAGRVPQHAQHLLKEATRCYFFGLELGCFALCRANLKSSLYARVGETELAAEIARHPRRGKLENLINATQRLTCLDAQYASTAHAIRRAANDVLHGTGETPMKRWTFNVMCARFWSNFSQSSVHSRPTVELASGCGLDRLRRLAAHPRCYAARAPRPKRRQNRRRIVR